jgi:zinc transporter ZupT
LLNVLVTHFLHSHHHHQTPELQQHVRQTHQRHQRRHPDPTTTAAATDAGDPTATTPARTTQTTTSTSVTQDLAQRLENEPPSICCASEDPVRDLEVLHQMAEILVAEQEQRERKQQHTIAHPKMTTLDENKPAHVHEKLNDEPPIDGANTTTNNVILDDGAESNSAGSSPNGSIINQDDDDTNHHHEDNDRKLLLRMSMNTAIAIGLHNFPEGLATFVATLHDPQVGVILAIAIAIHNIPEGLCVALPVYYATGSRSKAFGWAILSGLSEPLAAIFGYIILANAVTGTIYGILFGIVAGMMVMISTRELLPTAHRYDPTDRVVTYSFIFGMGILALSLVLFVL